MALDPNRFTRKTQEAFAAAQALARDTGNTEISTEHLLRALLDQPEGIVSGVIERIGVDVGALRRNVDEALEKLPRVSGAVRTPSWHERGLRPRMRKGANERRVLSTEHAARDDRGTRRGGDLLRGEASRRCRSAQVRGFTASRATIPRSSTGAEKYRRDLTEAAPGQDRPGHRGDKEIRRSFRCCRGARTTRC
jgi:ATP-dependent Clp protease ATP-binding subunit ClpB